MDSLSDYSFDWTQDPASLRRVYKESGFDDKFHKLIAKDVLDNLSPHLDIDEDAIQTKLIEPLEEFICGKEVSLSDLKDLKQSSKMCRKVLKTGDVLFSCNDCGFDATCVVCIDCFHKSEHKNHNYRMSNTDGGGCCDCGDVEAWKQYPACSDHMPSHQELSLSDFEDQEKRENQLEEDRKRRIAMISLLPDNGIANRYFLVCQAVLHYARRIISWRDYRNLPPELDIGDKDDEHYFTVLFNDEVHTYDHVINTLVKIIKCTKMTASVMASSVSREGRCFVLQDKYEICNQVKEAIIQARESGQGPLKVEVIESSILAHQTFALKLLEWIQKMSPICDAFRVLTAFTLLGGYDCTPEQEDEDKDVTLLEKIMLSNTTYWKMPRILWNDIFVSNLLADYSVKDVFARLLTRNYPRLLDDYLKDDHDHSVSILTMSTQLYTVPSLVCMLIEEENALSVISRTLVKVQGIRHSYSGHKRGYCVISDLRHLINIEPTKWTQKLRTNVVAAVKIFLELLSSMQGMDPVKRQMGQHVEYEPDWETGMSLQSRLLSLINKLVSYCIHDEIVLTQVLSETQRLLLYPASAVGLKRVLCQLSDHHAYCIQYDVSTAPVSVHLPLTRFAAALIVELMQRRPSDTIPYDESLVVLVKNFDSEVAKYNSNDSNKPSMVHIMEHSLRTMVMVSQFRSGMWRRNGFSLVNQILYYIAPPMRKEMFDRDILCIQECAATCESNEFMIHLINKFDLFSWFNSETTHELLAGPKAVSFRDDEEIITRTMSLAEEFLQLLLTIVGERYTVGVGKIQKDDVMKNEIIHLLCIETSTRSDLVASLFVNDVELDCIKTIANLRRSTESSLGRYELKSEYYDRFNPFFYHYTRPQQSQAQDSQLKRRRSMKEPLICCPPPEPVELTPQFKNLNELLKCDITLMMIQKVLRRSQDHTADSKECSKSPIRLTASDLQLDQCLHLIGLGLYEQERDPIGFGYLLAAHEKQIFSLLKDCYSAHRSKDLIHWLMKKTNDLTDRIDEIHANNLDEQQSRVHNEIRKYFNSILTTCDTHKQESKKESSEMAAQRRNRIMAMMKAKQEKFLSNPTTKQLAAETAEHEAPHSSYQPAGMVTNTTNTTTTTTANAHAQLQHQSSTTEVTSEKKNVKTAVSDNIGPSYLCILCRDEQCVGFDKPTMVSLAYIQRSSVLSKNRGQRKIPNYALTPSNQLKNLVLTLKTDYISTTPENYSYTSDNGWSFDATFMPSDLFFGPHISTCGHVMHYDCWQGYSEAVTKRETSRPNRGGRHLSFELDKNELLCPLCECISNATIPLLPEFNRTIGVKSRQWKLAPFLHALKRSVSSVNHIRCLQKSNFQPSQTRSERRQQPRSQEEKYMRLLQPTTINDVLNELQEEESFILRDFLAKVRDNKVPSSLCTRNLLVSIYNFSKRIHMVSLDLDKSITDTDSARIFMMTSWSISYTIQAHERSLRFKGTPLFEELSSARNFCTESLVRFACASIMIHQPDMIQSLLVRKLRYLLVADEYLMSSPCFLDLDAFELFVSIFIMMQKLYSHVDDITVSTSLNIITETKEAVDTKPGSTDDPSFAWSTRAYDHEFFSNLLHLMVIFNLSQVIISMQNKVDDTKMEVDSEENPSDDCAALHSFYKDIVLASSHLNDSLPPLSDNLVGNIKAGLLPFLRSCAIFYNQLSTVQPSSALISQSAFHDGEDFIKSPGAANHNQKLIDDEYDAICQYLGLPNSFFSLLGDQVACNLAKHWLHHPRVKLLIEQHNKEQPIPTTDLMPLKFINQPHSVNQLIDLPYDYSELVEKVSNFTCPSIKNEDCRAPTMCLVCGAMLCSQSYCCQRDLNDLAANYNQTVRRQDEFRQAFFTHHHRLHAVLQARAGERTVAAHAALMTAFSSNYPHPYVHQQLVGSCTYHAYECSGGVGIFLRIRNCQVLLMSNRTKGCYMAAPYIDDHGETDYGLNRGNPLHLNRNHYERLQHLWMNHAIPEHISRTLEYSAQASNINWHLH